MTALLTLAAVSFGVYAAMPSFARPGIVAAHLVLTLGMIAAWRIVGRTGDGVWRVALVAAVAFRLVLAFAPPALSGEVYRLVWDGRVQAAGHHPYKFAPSDRMRSSLRDQTVYPRIEEPDVPTIHPPLAEMLFGALAWSGFGVRGFKLAMALADVGAIAALVALLHALGRPRHHAILYAWNPLAVVEAAWSGHVEPVGIALLLVALAAIVRGRGAQAAAALAAAVQSALLTLLLVPGFIRRLKAREVFVLVAVALLIAAPYAVRGPAYGAGVLAYAHRFEHGSIAFPAVLSFYENVDVTSALTEVFAAVRSRWGSAETRAWEALDRSVRPQELARLTVALLAVGWAVAQSFRPRIDAAHEARLALGGALLLAPTLHPWSLLWVVPLAAAGSAGGWLLAAALVPLQYLAGPGEIGWAWRVAILGPPVAWMALDSWRAWRRRRAAPDAT